MLDALRDGVKYANGGRAMKHLGIPAITVPMGMLEDKKMPVGITFAGKAWNDSNLLRYAFAYERATLRRSSPPLTPSLDTDIVRLEHGIDTRNRSGIDLTLRRRNLIRDSDADSVVLRVSIIVAVSSTDPDLAVQDVVGFSNEGPLATLTRSGDEWCLEAEMRRTCEKEKYPTLGKVPRDQFMIVILARASNGRSAGLLLLED